MSARRIANVHQCSRTGLAPVGARPQSRYGGDWFPAFGLQFRTFVRTEREDHAYLHQPSDAASTARGQEKAREGIAG